MFTKFAAFEVISAVMVPSSTSQDSANSMVRTAHKAVFDYEVRPGYLYVRSRAISSRCNDNFDEFPAEEIKAAYKTFIGKPVFVNHNNDNHRRARGVCIDAVLHEDTLPDGRPDTWAEVLMEVDAVNFPKLAEAILKGHIERTSMGTDVKYSICSICSNKATSPAEYCQHIPRQKGQRIYRADPKTGVKEGILIREICYGLSFFENSLLVEPPADPTAFFTGVDTRGVTKAASKTASDWDQFDSSSHYRSGHQDGGRADYEYRDQLMGLLQQGRKLDPEDIDYLAGHAAGEERSRNLAAGNAQVKRVFEEHGADYGKTAQIVNTLSPAMTHNTSGDTSRMPSMTLCNDHHRTLKGLQTRYNNTNGTLPDGWSFSLRNDGTKDGTCDACTADSINDIFNKTAADNPVFLAPKFEDFGSEDSYDDEEDYENEPRKNKGQGSAYRPSWQTRRRALWRNRLKSAISEHGVSWIPFMNEMKATTPGINNQRLLGHYHRMLKQDPDNFHAFVQGIADNSSSGKTSSKIAKIKTYWHVSPEDFSRGDTIKPAAETGKGGHWGFDYPKDKVYLSKDFDDAHHWAHLLHQRLRLIHGEEHEPQNVHIYEVEAPESSRHPMHESTTGYEFKAPHARVVNRETTVYADDDVDPDGSGWLQSNCDHCGEPWFEKEVGARKTAGMNPRTAAFVQRVQANLSKVAEETADNSYGWAHRPGTPDDGIPAWDLTQNVPADVYTHPHYYSDMSEPSNRKAHNILGRIRNNPEAKVHIYRSLPAEEANHGIKPGDWVSISKEYARQHGKQEDPKDDWPVIRATVKAKDLFTDADDFREFGFWGEKPVVHGIHFKGGKNQEVSVRSDGSIRAVQRRNQTQASVVDFFHQATDNDLLQFFAEGVDPFLRVKATAEVELNKAVSKHDAVIQEAERPLESARGDARLAWEAAYEKRRQAVREAQEKLDPHDAVRKESQHKADDEFSPHEDRLALKGTEAYEEYRPHEKAHENKINDLRNEHYTEENKLKSRLRDAHDEYAPHAEKLRNSSDVDHEAAHEEHRPHLEAFEQAKAKAHKDFDDYTVKHNKAVDDANAELEPHKQAYNARHEAILAELQPHKDKRDAAYAAAEDVFAPHRQEYKRAAQVADDAVDEARKVWGDKVEAAQQEHEDSGRADVVRREREKRNATFSRFYTQMRNAPHPRNLEYKFHDETRHGEDDMHEVSVHHDGQEVGHVRWANDNHYERDRHHMTDDYGCDNCGDTFDNYNINEDDESICPHCEEEGTVYENDSDEDSGHNYFPGEIGYIHVDHAYRRHGIATGLVQAARDAHDDGDATTRAEHSDNKTAEGRAWHQRMVEKDPKMASLIQHFAVKVNEGLFWESPDDRHEVHIEKQGPNHVVRLDDNLTGESHYPTRGANDQLNLGDKLEGLPNEVRHSLVNALEVVHNDAEAKQHERGAQVPPGEVAHHENDFKQEDLNLWREKQIKKWLEDEIHLSSSLLQHFAPTQHFGAKDFDLDDVKLKYRVGHYLDSKVHRLEAFHNGNKIGHFNWALEPNDYEAPGEIAGVDVDREYQNKGVATKMFLEAHDMWRRGEVKQRPYHSYNSDAAEDWIDSLRKKNPEFGVTRYDLDEKYPDDLDHYSDWHKSALLQHFAAFQRESVVEYDEDYDQPTDDMADNVPDDGYLAAREKHNRKIEKQREKNVGILFDADVEYNDRKLEHNEEISNLNHEFVSALQPHKQKLSDAEEAYKPHLKALRESVEKNWEDHPDDQKARDLAQVSISAAHQPHQDAISAARAEYLKRESEVRESFRPRSNALRSQVGRLADINQQVHQKANDDVRDLMDKRKKDLTENHPPQLRFEHDLSGRLDLNGWVMKAYHGNRHIGELHWSDGSDTTGFQKGEIAWIGVHPKYRNVGVATEMMRRARKHAEDNPDVARPEHSDNRTDMGMGWHQRLVQKYPTLASLRATGSAIWSSEDPRSDFYEGPKPEPDSHEGVDDPFLNARRKALHDYQAKAKPLLNEGADLREKRRKLHQWHTRAAAEILKQKGPTPIYERVPELVDLDKKYQSKINPLWVKQHENADAHTRVVGDYTKALRAAPSPENVTHHFSYDANNDHHVVAMHHGKKVGYLKWNDEADGYHGDGEIKMIEVHPDYQRHGIATNMMKYARDLYDSGEVGQNPEHSNDRTDDGDAWISQLPSSLSLLQHFASDEDPFLTIKKQEDAKLQAVRHGSEEEWSNAWKTYIQNMRNAPHPKNVEYKFHYDHGDDMHAVTAHHNGEEVGHLRWADDTHGGFDNFTGYFPGEISNIDVDPEYQRRGIATKMMERAREAGNSREANTRPEHSGSRTPAGKAWIDSLPPSLSLLQYFADYAMYVNLHDGDKEVTMDPVHEKQVQTHEEIPVTELWKRAPLASLNSHLLDHFNDTAVYSKKTSLKTLDLVYSMKEEDNNA